MRPDPIVVELTNRRLNLGLSQRAVASAVGTTQSAVSEWETGLTAPSLSSLRRWCGAVNCRLDLLPNPPSSEEVPDGT
jgi:transcriptional regulator with XRE-family HTH domain